MQPGDKVRIIANPGRVGIVGSETDGPAHRPRLLVNFLDGDEQFVLKGSLEKVVKEQAGPYQLMASGRYGRVSDLRGAITYYRLSGKLANLIYSLNTTNTQFLPYQFKPVLQFLDSPSSGILIADEVGLGKTIEAGLIWTELRARQDARRLLVVCPAMLKDKWKMELADRFGVNAEMVDAGELHKRLEGVRDRRHESFALIASVQGLRPSRGWDDLEEQSQSASAKLARFLEEFDLDEPLLDLVIIDEAHYLRNQETQTYRLGALLRPVALSMVMLSATPIQLRNRDLFNLLHLLDEDAFPYEWSFDFSLTANAPIVRLRDAVLAGSVDQTQFVNALDQALGGRFFEDNEQLEFLRNNPPDAATLESTRGRAELADQLDRINPLTKVVTRTLKRDVHENKVQREPQVLRVKLSLAEQTFYDLVTEKVRDYCADLDIAEGFMLTIPQRQMASCMAAACSGWLRKAADAEEEDAETVYEIYGDDDSKRGKKKSIGPLMRELISIVQTVGDAKALREEDSKYRELRKNLKAYWSKYPDKKVVLFSFYKNTLYYLAERLAADAINGLVLHGGMDKQEMLTQFASDSAIKILLSSEVASEGVDLQFSSLLVNYDLPWNPAKIEQRIGRIDRIGQEESKILIWNLVYEDTVDDRVYELLLERLNTFNRALGSMEVMLGDTIRTLGYELLSHKLTAAQESQRINTACQAIANLSRQQEKLEAEATNLIAHGDFIQNKVKAANELGRYIRGEDLFPYVKDFLDRHYEGCRLLASRNVPTEFSLEWSVQARMDFSEFLQTNRLTGRTQLLSSSPPKLLFENKLGKAQRAVERISQDHALVRFVSERLKASGKGPIYFPVSAIQLDASSVRVAKGVYVYTVARWSVSGSREVERLEYVVHSLSNDAILDGDAAEALVNAAALEGSDWLSAGSEVDNNEAARLQDVCRADLEAEFVLFRDAHKREDADRIRLMVKSLQQHLEAKRKKAMDRIASYEASGNPKRMRMIPAERGRIKKEELRIEQRIAELRLRAETKAQDSVVSSGLIKVQ
jgi:superfamily II DNA or RNA helicase